jgi:protein FrlC
MNLCFNTISFTPTHVWSNSHTLIDTAEILSEIGFDGMEIAAGRPHAWPSDLSQQERSLLTQYFERLGIEIVAICPLIAPHLNPASLYVQELRDAREYMIDCVRLASDLKSQLVVYPAGWVVQGTSPAEAWKHSCETLRIAAEEGRRHGVTVVVEAIRRVSSNLLWSSDQALRMVLDSAHPNVGLMMDTFHVWAEGEEPSEVINKYGERLSHIHMVDASESGGERRIPGDGVQDIAAVIEGLKEVGYEGALSVEIWGLDPTKMARDSYTNLKRLFCESV